MWRRNIFSPKVCADITWIKNKTGSFRLLSDQLAAIGGHTKRNSKRNRSNSLSDERQFVDDLTIKLNLDFLPKNGNGDNNSRNFSALYGLSYAQIAQNGGGPIIARYGNSPVRFLKAVYPEFEWYILL